MMGAQADGTHRHHALGRRRTWHTMVCLGTFAKHTVVNQASCVKILDHYPLGQGLPGGLRGHHRMGLRGLRRRRPSPATTSS